MWWATAKALEKNEKKNEKEKIQEQKIKFFSKFFLSTKILLNDALPCVCLSL